MRDASDALAVRLLIYGRLISEAVCTFAALGLPEQIAESPCRVDDLAVRCGLVAPRLTDLLRLLASCGLVSLEGDQVELTDRGRYLCADRPGSALPTALLVRERVGRAWDGLEGTLRTGRPAFDSRYGRTFFEEIDGDIRLRAIFDDSQARGLELELDGIADLVATRGCTRVIDIGGGDGFLLAQLLRRLPTLTGVLLDRPVAVQRARTRFAGHGLDSRCECVVGDFFDPLDLTLGPDDLVVMRHICHDWDDAACTTVLTRCREVLVPGARLALIEHGFDGPEPESDTAEQLMSSVMNLYMATVTSGRERTLADFEKLHAAAGLTVAGVTRIGGSCVIESTAGGLESGG
ncbi:methyltransferase [Nocardia higoensis]|uniref:methyltransferase n=1 Tax=Nocardia higoensis TaxID=228599 RepID=UPI0002D72497|nr:methyltransferase [Nocardia higoensis]